MFYRAGVALCFAVSIPATSLAAPGAPLAAYGARPATQTCLAGDAPPQNTSVRFVPDFADIAQLRGFDVRVWPLPPVAPETRSRFYFVDRPGRMYTLLPGNPATVALDIRPRIGVPTATNAYDAGGSEQWGLVSFAFHPDFPRHADRRWVFVPYQGRQANETIPTSYVARYTLGEDGLTFDPASELLILSQPQTTSHVHHFGHLVFGPDGFLYIGSGDGSNRAADNQAQSLADLRGKLLRIDVDDSTPDAPYAIPADNPWAVDAEARPEVYAFGLRNPWRFSIDSMTGDIWLGDVGLTRWEEVNLVTAGGNYGWRHFEGPDCLNAALCPTITHIPPLHAIPATSGAAIIGGHVYRGRALSFLTGKYLFHMYNRRELYAVDNTTSPPTVQLLLSGTPNLFSMFTDAEGEIYGVEMPGTGRVHKLVAGEDVSDDGVPPCCRKPAASIRWIRSPRSKA